MAISYPVRLDKIRLNMLTAQTLGILPALLSRKPPGPTKPSFVSVNKLSKKGLKNTRQYSRDYRVGPDGHGRKTPQKNYP